MKWARRGPRIAAAVIAVLSLVGLFLRPGRWLEIPPTSALLLTPGAPSKNLLAEEGWMRFALLDTSTTVPNAWQSLPDLAFLARHYPEVEHLRVLGHGLPAWEWDTFQGQVEIAEDPQDGSPNLGFGIREVTWTRQRLLGDELIVRGVLTGGAGQTGTLRLESPMGAEDSINLDGTSEQPFELRALPRDSGRLLYRWVLETDGPVAGGPLAGGHLDVIVQPPEDIAVLWLEDAPGFETRHVKDWLTRHGGGVAIRSRISRDRYRTEFHHQTSRDLSRLQLDLLKDFDLVVIDPPTLTALGSSRRKILRQAISEEGVGLLILPGSGTPPMPQNPPLTDNWLVFDFENLPDLDEISIVASWPDGPATTPLVLAARQITPLGGDDPLVFSDTGRILAASRLVGQGTVGLSLIHDSYRWVLEGHPEHHRRYWSRMIRALSRPHTPPAQWHLPTGPILAHRPMEILLETRQPMAGTRAAIRHEGVVESLELVADAATPHRQRALFWPRETGWHRLTLDDLAQDGQAPGGESVEAWFHVESAERWTTWRHQQRRLATQQRAVMGRDSPVSPPTPVKKWREWPRLAFYLAFLASVMFLWLDEHLRPV